MKTKSKIYSSEAKLAIQGYHYAPGRLKSVSFAIKLPFQVFAICLVLGLIANSSIALVLATLMSMAGALLPYHPLDYLLARTRKPGSPLRSTQNRIAFLTEAVMVAGFLIVKALGLTDVNFLIGGSLLCISLTAAITDISIPAIIYNRLRYASIYPDISRALWIFKQMPGKR